MPSVGEEPRSLLYRWVRSRDLLRYPRGTEHVIPEGGSPLFHYNGPGLDVHVSRTRQLHYYYHEGTALASSFSPFFTSLRQAPARAPLRLGRVSSPAPHPAYIPHTSRIHPACIPHHAGPCRAQPAPHSASHPDLPQSIPCLISRASSCLPSLLTSTLSRSFSPGLMLARSACVSHGCAHLPTLFHTRACWRGRVTCRRRRVPRGTNAPAPRPQNV